MSKFKAGQAVVSSGQRGIIREVNGAGWYLVKFENEKEARNVRSSSMTPGRLRVVIPELRPKPEQHATAPVTSVSIPLLESISVEAINRFASVVLQTNKRVRSTKDGSLAALYSVCNGPEEYEFFRALLTPEFEGSGSYSFPHAIEMWAETRRIRTAGAIAAE